VNKFLAKIEGKWMEFSKAPSTWRTIYRNSISGVQNNVSSLVNSELGNDEFDSKKKKNEQNLQRRFRTIVSVVHKEEKLLSMEFSEEEHFPNLLCLSH